MTDRPLIAVLPGDGIGPEVTAAAGRLLEAIGDFELREYVVGGASIDAHGKALTDEVLEACRSADAVLLGAVGGPKWDTTDPDAPRPEQGLLGLRKGLGLFANLRPVRPFAALADASPLRPEVLDGTDLLVVRELTGGIYFGDKGREGDHAHDACVYSVEEIERIARVGFESAGRRGGEPPRVASVDKANVLETSRLWREVVSGVAADYPDVELEHVLVDNAAMQLVANPARFDVILTENMFGDILSDESAMLTGSLGMLPSASLGGEGPGLFEPVHGSAPDIAGQGIANPLATFLSVAMMLRHGLDRPADADRVEAAVEAALERGLRTADLAGEREDPLGTDEMTEAVLAALTVPLRRRNRSDGHAVDAPGARASTDSTVFSADVSSFRTDEELYGSLGAAMRELLIDHPDGGRFRELDLDARFEFNAPTAVIDVVLAGDDTSVEFGSTSREASACVAMDGDTAHRLFTDQLRVSRAISRGLLTYRGEGAWRLAEIMSLPESLRPIFEHWLGASGRYDLLPKAPQPVFRAQEDLHAVAGGALRSMLNSAEAAGFGSLDTVVRFEIHEPSAFITLVPREAATAVVCDAGDSEPGATISMSGDTMHQLFSGDVYVTEAVGAGEVTYSGPGWRLSRLLPLPEAVRPHYKRALELAGLEHEETHPRSP